MTSRAWAYILSVLLVGAILSGLALQGLTESTFQWLTFAALTALATSAQLYTARAPGHQSYHLTIIFFFAGIFLLTPALFVLLVVIPHLVEWAKERLVNSPRLRNWYLQPFNIAVHIIAGSAAGWLYTMLAADIGMSITPSSVLTIMAAAILYVSLNHLLIGQALVLARGVSWRESGVLAIENLVTDLILLLLGYTVSVLWTLNPALIVPALSPLVLIYRALMIPQLKQEARTDEKTGLWNARHFLRLFEAEFERATRFQRPLALIMADLDLLRNINNTYGHLAGDAVLSGIGQIIRETIREYDIAGRFGGEEFAIALPETQAAEAVAIAERIRQAVETTSFEISTTPTPIHATMSLGVACFPTDASTTTDLIHEADVAVYQAKLKGRNRVVNASDVPHYIKLESAAAEERVSSLPTPSFSPRPQAKATQSSQNPVTSSQPTPAAAPKHAAEGNGHCARTYPRAWVWSFISAVIIAGAGLTCLAFIRHPQLDLVALGLLIAMAAAAELAHVDLYDHGAISVGVALVVAAALITGIPGVAAVSAASALAHSLRRRPAIYKTAFNWATHVLAGSVPALTISLLAIPVRVSNLPLLTIPIVLTAPAYYIVETGLIAAAISFSSGAHFITTWRDRFRWLAGHYIVLGFLGLFVAIAFVAFGPLGAVVFTLPVLMMRYAQKQYIDRTQESVRELTRMNQELSQANQEVISASRAIRRLNDELFLTLSKIIDARDPYVHGHAAKVADYATAIAVELDLPADVVERVRQAAFLHDIGKLGISEQVLHKPAELTDEEYEYVKGHVTLGAEFLETSCDLRHLS
ncbi:MAG: diguanylate cyclase, partial [Chloroflexi bacterium]